MESSLAGMPLLSTLIGLPFATALVIALLPRGRTELVKLAAVLGSAATGVLSVWMLIEFDQSDPGFQFASVHEWIETFGIGWSLGVDGISLFLVVLTGLLFPLTILGVPVDHDQKTFYAWTMVLMGAVMGAFLATDLFLFFVFFELTLVPMYLLIGGWGHGNRVYAATKFFLYTMFGSAFLLVGMVALVLLTQDGTGGPTFSLEAISAALTADDSLLTRTEGRVIFLSFVAAFAVKIPMFPVHTWLPDAHTEAPTVGSVILAGVLLKLGSYGLLRFGLFLFGAELYWARHGLMVAGVIGIVYGAVVAAMQTDLKRLVAYSSVAHMGFIVIGVASLTTEGLDGSVIQMVNHGVSTGALFLLVGMIYERRHTREIAELGGLQKSAPVMAALFTLVMLSSIGLPGLNGFVGEFLILQGTFLAADAFAVVAASGVIFAALYLLWAYQRVFHGPADGDNATMPDIRASEVAVLLPFLAAIIFFGVSPAPVLERMEPAVECALRRAETSGGFERARTEAHTEATSKLDEARSDELVAEFSSHGHGDDHGDDHGDEHGSDEDDGDEHGSEIDCSPRAAHAASGENEMSDSLDDPESAAAEETTESKEDLVEEGAGIVMTFLAGLPLAQFEPSSDDVEAFATPSVDWAALAPLLILAIGGLLLLTVDSLVRRGLPAGFHALWTVVVASAAGLSTIGLWERVLDEGGPFSTVGASYGIDGFSLFLTGVLCAGVVLAALIGDGWARREGLEGPTFFVLILLSASGGVIMAGANDLIVLFLGLETLSIVAYLLAALHLKRIESQEAGLKYFVLGAFSSAFLLYGIAMVYGATGSTNLVEIAEFLSTRVVVENGLLLLGMALMLVGLGFKVAAVPFHTWTPDVYDGSPGPVVAFMASVVKAAGFAALVRVFVVAFDTQTPEWQPLVFAGAVLTLFGGAVLALLQTNVKRMLAYSSISHAGFLLVSLGISSPEGVSALLFYLATYTFLVAGSFAVVTAVDGAGDNNHDLSDYRALGRRHPSLALAFTFLLLAQAGVPLTSGFVAKFGVINAAAGEESYLLAVLAMVSAVIAAFLYLRLVGTMWMVTTDDELADGEVPLADLPRPSVSFGTTLALATCVIVTLGVGIFPDALVRLADDATPHLVCGSQGEACPVADPITTAGPFGG